MGINIGIYWDLEWDLPGLVMTGTVCELEAMAIFNQFLAVEGSLKFAGEENQ